MNEKQPTPRRARRFHLFLGFVGLLAAGSVAYAMFAVPFLAVTRRVDANVLVVEGWLAPRMLPAVVEEYHRGHYSLVLISGMENTAEPDQSAVTGEVRRTLQRLEELGVPGNQLMPCPAPFAKWYRTAHSARGVRARILALAVKPTGINVITEGIHARKTWVAFEYVLGDQMPVGIVAIPEARFSGYRWLRNRWAVFDVARDFVGWLREVLFPLRS